MKHQSGNDLGIVLRGAESYAAQFEPVLEREPSGPSLPIQQQPVRGTLHEPPPKRRRRWRAPAVALAVLVAATAGVFVGDRWRSLFAAERQVLPASAQVVALGDTVLVQVKVRPANAQLFVDGELAASNPIRVRRDGRLHRLLGVAEGHKSVEVPFYADIDQQLRMNLVRRKR